jgi:hypothetical protein
MKRDFDRTQHLTHPDLEDDHIWVTSMGRITKSDKKYGEVFSMPHDQPVMTIDEFEKGIKLEDFEEKVEEAKEARK